MRDVLTIQALAAKKQQDFSPLGMTSENSRPSYDYVKKGDVVRIAFSWSNQTPAATSAESTLRQRLAQYFNVVNFNSSRGWTFNGNVSVDLQTRSDYSHIADITSIVLHQAEAAGFTVWSGGAQAEFVSKVEDTGGDAKAGIKIPGTDPNQLEKLVDNLTSSPMSLALILGGAALLLFVVKR